MSEEAKHEVALNILRTELGAAERQLKAVLDSEELYRAHVAYDEALGKSDKKEQAKLRQARELIPEARARVDSLRYSVEVLVSDQ